MLESMGTPRTSEGVRQYIDVTYFFYKAEEKLD
jgi:hypothetical protein